MKTLILLLLLAVVVVVVVLVVFVARRGQREYQHYSGLERQRAAAKQSRDAGVDRLKDAERHLVAAQRELIGRGEHIPAQAIERLRTRLSTMADRHRFATHGYAPLNSANPVQEAELADLQERDSEAITDAQMISDLSETVEKSSRDGRTPELGPLESALDHFTATLDRRKAMT